MPGTAVFVYYVSEGFAFAADGREKLSDKIRDNVQKVFPLSGAENKLGFACIGVTSVYDPDGSLRLDFKATVNEIAGKIRNHPPHFTAYFDVLVRRINRALKQAGLRDMPDVDGLGTLVRLVVAGYYRGASQMGLARFFHSTQKLSKEAEIDFPQLRSTTYQVFGAVKVWKALLENDDPRLSSYGHPVFVKLKQAIPIGLLDAVAAARIYVNACLDETAIDMDSDSKAIGGHFHAATITSRQGFQWVIAPE